jgi:CRISPR-associated Csx2 family protein
MAKILISSLGTGKREDGTYKKANYKIDTKIYQTSFIAEALQKHLQIDKIFLVGTKKSIWDEAYTAFGGLDDTYHEFLYDSKEEGSITLEKLEKFDNLQQKLQPFVIDYGINEEELWMNFEKFLQIAQNIKDGDELYLDITHSFRSLSLMSFVMTQFAASITDKNFKISGVFYGMLEYSYENNDITPVVDIKILLEIQEWIKAIDAIKKYSDFDPLVRLLEVEEDIEKGVKNTFIQLNNTLQLAYISALEVFIKTANKKIKTISSSSNKIINLLAPQIIYLVEELSHEKKSHFQFALAKWFFRNKNYAFSYLALYESIISKSCELKNYDVNDHKLREDAKTKIGHDKYGKFFYTKYENSISVIRNAIAHQNEDRQQDDILQDIQRLKQYLITFEEYIYI